MFTLSQTGSGKLVYRCHGCRWECELTATDQVALADEEMACNEGHECSIRNPPIA
jgi:hypothetical protein